MSQYVVAIDVGNAPDEIRAKIAELMGWERLAVDENGRGEFAVPGKSQEDATERVAQVLEQSGYWEWVRSTSGA